MAEPVNVQKIVAGLNAPPFEKKLSLVTFDELSPSELLQLLNDVFAHLDEAHKIDVRDEPPEIGGPRMLQFLKVLKVSVPSDPDSQAAFQSALLAGDRGRVYPVLQYVLDRLDILKKRAYVAKFLLPVPIPPEYVHDETTQTLLEQLGDLQEEFRETHKALDAMRADGSDPAELKREISQLESERRQLLERIEGLKKKTGSLSGFAAIFEATSNLRKEQEEEAKLADRLADQRAALAEAEVLHRAAARRLAEARAKSRADASASELVAAARREEEEHRGLLDRVLPEAMESRRATLARLQDKLSGPRRGMDDVASLQASVRDADARLAATIEHLAEKERAAGESKLGLFRQQSLLVSRKLQSKAVEVERAKRAVEEASAEVERREARLAEMAGARHMRKEDFVAYAASVRAKLQQIKRLKAEQATMRAETAVLGRTEQLLKGRAGNVDELLAKLEERRGVAGYTLVESAIDKVSGQKARVDATKGAMLEEISRLVRDIKAQVQSMSPILAELRKVRTEFADVEGAHKKAKARFATEAAGFTARRARLEKEADTYQADAIGTEQQYQQLVTLISVADMRLERAESERSFRAGDGQLLRDIETHERLLHETFERQDKLHSVLTGRQREIQEFSTEHAAQRRHFDAMVKLLGAKAAAMRDEAAAEAAQAGAGGAGIGMTEVGGANVMTIE
ncbi:hypothetical protein FNF27_06097 [Cafeteria roenbergensis]|uniref:IFT81 calponin homology domain-containing protein n=1 Tax=Cafeteria roenbergensis TaxID=33653 RepID=A0A5A8E4L0_CAFRO|nr:hypothetical protein FNF29_07030 [Cafeteria roenbergensis]KAA0155268.1 hypothetical protein FNF28_06735 [Cafeteria roenbergensis]KAA0158184.1 hypothetical protein FNF31_05515 [Cafeteria roenbergensis]KAA0172298.1 hypothetical protein FNF27_06097 [Cafeteria roenbergensis]|eukprot:KAA0147941.1 hypothetical protein FNF29_07030 [Cafeteria roenbergensis]